MSQDDDDSFMMDTIVDEEVICFLEHHSLFSAIANPNASVHYSQAIRQRV